MAYKGSTLLAGGLEYSVPENKEKFALVDSSMVNHTNSENEDIRLDEYLKREKEILRTTEAAVNALDAEFDGVLNAFGSVDSLIGKANADLSNVDVESLQVPWLQDLLVRGGIVAKDGTFFNLTGVHINGGLIDAGTIKADQLLLQGEDGLYYKINVSALGETTAESDEKYKFGIDGQAIVRNSITAEQITTENIQGLNGWINFTEGTFSYGDVQHGNPGMTWDGENLLINASTIKMSSGHTVEETINNMTLDRIKIGGNNLLQNTNEPSVDNRINLNGSDVSFVNVYENYSGTTAAFHAITDAYPGEIIPCTIDLLDLNGLAQGETYTISGYAKCPYGSLNDSNTDEFKINCYSSNGSKWELFSQKTITVNSEYGYFSHTFTVPATAYGFYFEFFIEQPKPYVVSVENRYGEFFADEDGRYLIDESSDYLIANSNINVYTGIYFDKLMFEHSNIPSAWSPSQKDLEEQIEATAISYTDAMKDNIMEELDNKYQEKIDLSDYVTKSDLELNDQGITAIVEAYVDPKFAALDLDGYKKEIAGYMRYFINEDLKPTLELGEKDSASKLQLTNDKMSFVVNDQIPAYIDGNKMFINNVEAVQTLILGQFCFTPRQNGNLSFGLTTDLMGGNN